MFSETGISLSITSPECKGHASRGFRIPAGFIILLAILLIAILVRGAFHVGLGFADDFIYARMVRDILTGTFTYYESIFRTRIFFLYAMSLSAFLFGYGEVSLTLFPLLCSLGQIVLVYFFGKEFFDKRTGLIAALLLAIYPQNILYSTRIMPDIPLACMLGFNLYFLFRGISTRRKIYFFFSGIFLGLSYLIKAIGLMQAAPIFLFLLVRSNNDKSMKKRFMVLVAALVLVLACEAVYYSMVSGNPLERLQVISGTYDKTIYQGDRMIDIVEYYPRLITLTHHSHFKFLYGLFFYAGGLLVVVTCLSRFLQRLRNLSVVNTGPRAQTRRYAFLFLICWMLFWFCYLQFGSMSLSEYRIIEKHERFLSLITMPVMLLIAVGLSRCRTYGQRVFSIIIIVALAASSLFFVEINRRFHGMIIDDVRSIKVFIDKQNGDCVYADGQTIAQLDFLYGFNPTIKLKNLAGINNLSEIDKGAYVVINSREYRDLPLRIRRQCDDVAALWKRGWRLEFSIEQNILENVKENIPLVFKIPELSEDV